MSAVRLYLDRLKELGVDGVTIPIGYPLYTPGFPRYDAYVQFYKQVAQEVRKRGMTLAVESSVIFANTEFSSIQLDYSGLTFEKFEAERKEMVARIIEDTRPDYLNLGAEPDTQFELLHFEELANPAEYSEYVNHLLDGLDRGSTKIGAGIGSWGNLDYARRLADGTTLDSIHLHVYPIYKDFLEKILTISEIARQHGKRIVLDEAWLLKADKPPTGIGSVAASPEHFRRDAFSFWAPLDQKFLTVIAKIAKLAQIEYISPFWTQLFFAYIDYNSSNAHLSYRETSELVNRAASANLVGGSFSSTGEAYRKLVGGFTSISAQGPTSTLSTALSQETTENANDDQLPALAIGVMVAAIALVIIFFAAMWLRRSESGLG